MSDVFISYAHSTARQARGAAAALRALGYSVWLDDDLPAHRVFSAEIETQLAASKAALVIWSAEAAKSDWVLSEANRAREEHKLVQLRLDQARLPMPFDQIHCADLSGWSGEGEHPAWGKVAASIAHLVRDGGRHGATSDAEPALPLPDKPSLAVMPFANLSGDSEQDYFADGMVEEIIATLSRFRSIFVIGTGSTLSFKGKAVSPADVGRQLGVRYLLEGSVRKSRDRVRIAVKLTDTADGAQIWADRFEDTLEDIFDLQDRVALGVAAAIAPTVLTLEIQRAARKPSENLTSYDLYLRALPFVWPANRERVGEARRLLKLAIEQDPEFAPALARLAQAYATSVTFRWSGDKEESHRRGGIELARRAARAAPDDPAVLVWAGLAMILLAPDWRDGALYIERAVALNPGDANAQNVHGCLELLRGEPERAISDFQAALRLDPLGDGKLGRGALFTGFARFQQRRFAEAAQLLSDAAVGLDSPQAWSMLAATRGQLGDVEKAREALARHLEQTGGVVIFPAMLAGRPEYREMFEEGIATAKGRAPSPGKT